MNLLRVIGWKLGLWKLVVLEDFDHEPSLRRLRKSWHPSQFGIARRMWPSCNACLNHDGTVAYPSFVKKWWLYPAPRDEEADEIAKLERMMSGPRPLQ